MFGRAVAESDAPSGTLPIFLARLLTALLQALALYLLAEALEAPLSWPATERQLFIPMLLVSAYVPLVLQLGLGQIRPRPLAIWAAIASVVIAGLGYHHALRGMVAAFPNEIMVLPSFSLWLALSAGLYIAHVLVVDAVIERRLVPSYPRHFDTAWKQGVQMVLAASFVGVFWGVLELGAELFKLVDIDFFRRLIEHRWFAFPATTLALAVSVHVTDVQPALIRGARSLALTLFSWLLPLVAIILLGFLASLPFISLVPLWQTHFATALLLAEIGLLVLLINACYQDGAAEKSTSRIKRWAGTLGAVELLPLAGLAIWGLSLRVGQYGWSGERIMAAAILVVASCYALGYASAVVVSPSWLKRIEAANFATAYVVLALILVLFSPIADPARLMVADQVARLKSGALAADKFDFVALKFDGARWGAAALAELSQAKDGADAPVIATKAARALAATNRYAADHNAALGTPEELATRVTVYPEGRSLPAGFLAANFGVADAVASSQCLRGTGQKCLARFVTLHPGEAEALLFLDGSNGSLFEADAQGQWHKTGQMTGPLYCVGIRRGFEKEDIQVEPHALPDLVMGGQRLGLTPVQSPCPPP